MHRRSRSRSSLAFFFGYAFTAVPLLRSGLALGAAAGIAFAADTISIAVMEIVDNAVLLVVPGAMEAGLDDPLFWGSLAFALAVAFVAAYPVNRWLIARGRGHAVVPTTSGARARERPTSASRSVPQRSGTCAAEPRRP